jgi:hypothetical protein
MGCESVEWIRVTQDRIKWWIVVKVVEPSGPVKNRELIDQLHNCWLLKKDSDLWSYITQDSYW